MISLFLTLSGAGFLYLFLAIKTDETGRGLSPEKIKSQLYLALLFLALGLVDFFIAPLNPYLVLIYRIVASFLLLYGAGRASRQIATTIYYLTALLLLVRVIIEFFNR